MDIETTIGDIFEEIAEALALARTKALMGERKDALDLFRSASDEFRQFQEVLNAYPGFQALEHSLNVTLIALYELDTEGATAEKKPPRAPAGSRPRTRRAA